MVADTPQQSVGLGGDTQPGLTPITGADTAALIISDTFKLNLNLTNAD